eukprot:scaffold41025_cov70-Attheya_sp.AAC.1
MMGWSRPSEIGAAGRWWQQMAMGLSVTPLGRIYFFLANYWLTIFHAASGTMAGCWLQWMAPLVRVSLSLCWSLSATIFHTASGGGARTTDGDAMTAMGLYVSALLIQGYSEERGPVRINCTATDSSKYARV